ncbi:hypothetical protein [uncultured Methanobacterium sp.]|uniref:hypothetical protein n=1 Tax=uncultured Methanobacterium sp. TaxID=176306 RepID=UPI002AA7FC47|nr:hypothetical protein [uncultured Methanobacterium sp.]
MLVHEGTSLEKLKNKVVVHVMFKDEKVTNLDEIKYLETILEEKLHPYKNSENNLKLKVTTQEGVNCFSIEFITTKPAHTPEEIEEIVEEFENKIEEEYIPLYNGVRTSMG